MRSLIIDASATPLRDYVRRYGTTDGLLYGGWYRVLRPAMVLLMWVLFGLYVHHSLVTVGGTAAELAELIVYVSVVAGMAALLVSWMIIYGFHNWIRQRDLDAAAEPFDVPHVATPIPWQVEPGVRLLRVEHDDAGDIVNVAPWVGQEVLVPARAA